MWNDRTWSFKLAPVVNSVPQTLEKLLDVVWLEMKLQRIGTCVGLWAVAAFKWVFNRVGHDISLQGWRLAECCWTELAGSKVINNKLGNRNFKSHYWELTEIIVYNFWTRLPILLKFAPITHYTNLYQQTGYRITCFMCPGSLKIRAPNSDFSDFQISVNLEATCMNRLSRPLFIILCKISG